MSGPASGPALSLGATLALGATRPRALRARRAIWVVALMTALAIASILAAYPRIEARALRQAGADDAATLQLATQVLRGALERTQALPALIAERPILRRLLADPGNAGLVPFTNEVLRQSALSLDVSDIYVMDTEGLTVATSNYRTGHSFLGRNFAFRPYFIDALDAGLGRFHALGTTSGERGYFFAAPVVDETEIAGVIVVKLTLDRFETTWSETAATLIVTDANNIIFMSDRPDWHFRSLGPLPEAAIEQIAATRQYPAADLVPLGLEVAQLPGAPGIERVRITDAAGTGDYLRQTALIAAPGLRVSILTPTGPAIGRAWSTVLLASLAAALAGLTAAAILDRRARLIERLAAERALAALLEARVAERTAELQAENAERRATEDRLRRTQAELVQAGKLAALGQMSAALSHEFNQPLAAVKSYAENAAAFLDRGRLDEARGNILRISGMADRMAKISRHLRNFARRPQERTGPVELAPIVADALELMAPRLRAAGVAVDHDPGAAPIRVRGGRVRLQQVVVNLIGNALDAMEGIARPRIEIRLTGGAAPGIEVRDIGPGLSEAALAQAFDPFFTTKDVGQGLGLGLSISYNIVRDFGGTLSASNHPEGGAVFHVALEAAEAVAEKDTNGARAGMAAE